MLANRKKTSLINEYPIVKIHDFLYSRHKYSIISLSVVLYLLVIFLFHEQLAISSNYFVLLPLVVIAISFGFKGGLIAGILSLPANRLIFAILDHPEYAPVSTIIAGASGILMGSILGYISDFFTMMKKEIHRREQSERTLEKMVREKEILLNEISHRVKNNLNFITSLIKLQNNRISSPEQQEELEKLNNRIMSIALVQDLLFSQDSIEQIDFRIYLREITDYLLSAYHETVIIYELKMDDQPLMLESKRLTALGLIANEIITNAEKYAFTQVSKPKLIITLCRTKDFFDLSFRDNGPGISMDKNHGGLGMKLIKTLTESQGGHFELSNDPGLNFTFHFPIKSIDIGQN